MESGVATRPMSDLDAYAEQLQHFVYHSGAFMKPLFSSARQLVRDGGKARIVFTEGEEERVRSEEHTSELQSLMRISYAVFCLKKKENQINSESKNIKTNDSNS